MTQFRGQVQPRDGMRARQQRSTTMTTPCGPGSGQRPTAQHAAQHPGQQTGQHPSQNNHPQQPPRETWISVAVELGRLLDRQLGQALTPFDLSVGQFMALDHIMNSPGINRASLARRLQITPQAAGGLSRQLVEKGLLHREVAERGLPIALTVTEAGRRKHADAAPAVEALSTNLLLRCVRPGAVAQMDGAFRHVLIRLSEVHDGPER
ncbi:MAG TPA: MarR family transcriptional regulator [Pseudonocardia sp.]|nr:MarR family transcriptional regulator [Pseudonocardia sp.]